MKLCAACHEDLPKDKFSKKQWKLEKRRCKICVSDNREVQPLPPSPTPPSNTNAVDSNASNDGGRIDRLLESMSINDREMIPASDDDLFKQPPTEDCPICFIRMPSLNTGRKYQVCCGKSICTGCMREDALRCHEQLCPFCRFPAPLEEGLLEMCKKRVELDDPQATYSLGVWCGSGMHGLSQDFTKALELYHRAGELGYAHAYNNIGIAFCKGEGVERDSKKAMHYWELAAMGGDAMARCNLGIIEQNKGNVDRALKHYMISTRGGNVQSLESIKELFMKGYATKKDYADALQARQAYLDEIRSDQRDKAAAVHEMYTYY